MTSSKKRIEETLQNHHLTAGSDQLLVQDVLARQRVFRPVEQVWVLAHFTQLHNDILEILVVDLFRYQIVASQ